jgi:hypothetical protein
VAAVAIELDGVLGDTRPLYEAWLADVSRRAQVDPARLEEELPNWRVLLERFAEDHAPVYLRPADRGARDGARGAGAAPRAARAGGGRGSLSGRLAALNEGPELTDRQLEAVLERLDRIAAELARLNKRQESRDELAVIAHELRNLNESLQAMAYAALGQSGPQVRRRRTG